MAVKNKDAEAISTAVRIHRKACGLTQLELADLAGVGKTTVFDVEHGKDSVRLINLLRILHALNLQLSLISPLSPRSPADA
jgi:y4mF family transcriptional regulator